MYLATKPSKPADDLGDAAVVGADHVAQVLGVEPRGERGRADEVAEHDRELTPLGLSGRCGPRGRRVGGFPAGLASRGDSLQQALAIAERDAELLEIGIGEIGEHVGADRMGSEGLGVAAESQVGEPLPDVSHASPGGAA